MQTGIYVHPFIAVPIQAKDWSWVSTVIIGLVAAAIAWQQYKVSRDKIKLDLYQKRFQVYQNVVRYFNLITNTPGGMSTGELEKVAYEFFVSTREAQFLFDKRDNIFSTMKELREIFMDYDFARNQNVFTPGAPAKKEILMDKIEEKMLVLERAIEPYVSFRSQYRSRTGGLANFFRRRKRARPRVNSRP